MARNPWPRRPRSTKPDPAAPGAPVVGAASAATPEATPDQESPDDPPVAGDAAVPGKRALRKATPRKSAMDILARREHTVAELREKLRARGFDEPAIESTLAALLEEGLLSEARFVESFIGSYARRGKGPVWIRAELERRGIPSAAIAEALAASDTDWQQAARDARHKRFGLKPPADARDRARQLRFLQGRGFTAEQARGAFAGGDDDPA